MKRYFYLKVIKELPFASASHEAKELGELPMYFPTKSNLYMQVPIRATRFSPLWV